MPKKACTMEWWATLQRNGRNDHDYHAKRQVYCKAREWSPLVDAHTLVWSFGLSDRVNMSA
jgi:hypothetical protein